MKQSDFFAIFYIRCACIEVTYECLFTQMRLRCIDDGSTADLLAQYIYEIPTELESEPKKVGIWQTNCNNFVLSLCSTTIFHLWLYGTEHKLPIIA